MALVRAETYVDYAWPKALGMLYRHAGLTSALTLASGLALFLALGLARNGTLFPGPLAGDFYAVFPHNLLAMMFGAVFAFAALAFGVGVARFWRGIAPGRVFRRRPPARRRSTCCASDTSAAATAPAATTKTMRSACRGGASII